MEDRTFDQFTRRLGGSLDRRTGLKGLLAGLTGIFGISAAEARVQVPPICGGTGMQCASGDECCSGRCIVKSDGTSRCARTTSNRKKKKKKGGGGGSAPVPPPDCTVCANGCPYSTIEEAILNAADGSEVTIYQGSYQPTNIVNSAEAWTIKIGKSLTVKACDANTDAVSIRPEANKLLFNVANTNNSSSCQSLAIAVTLSGLVIDGTNIYGALAVQTGCNFDSVNGFKMIDCEVKGFDGQNAPIGFFAGPVLVEDCNLHDNASDSYRGSLIHTLGPNVTIKDSSIYSNTSRTGSADGGIVGQNGSGVLALTGSTEIRNNVITNPNAQTQGGGVWVGISQTPNWGIEGTVHIHSNTGASSGGGIAAYTEPTAGSVVDITTVYNNTATTCSNVYIGSNSTCT